MKENILNQKGITTMMNATELKNVIRDTVAKSLIEMFPDMRSVPEKPYTFVVPVEIEGRTYWGKLGLTSAQLETKSKEAFDGFDCPPAAEAFDAFLEQRAAEAAAKKASSAKKKKTKKDEE